MPEEGDMLQRLLRIILRRALFEAISQSEFNQHKSDSKNIEYEVETTYEVFTLKYILNALGALTLRRMNLSQ